MPAVRAARIRVAGYVLDALAADQVGVAVAGEAFGGLIVGAGRAGELAVEHAVPLGVGREAVDARGALLPRALLALIGAGDTLRVDEGEAGSAGSALGNVGGGAVRAGSDAADAGLVDDDEPVPAEEAFPSSVAGHAVWGAGRTRVVYQELVGRALNAETRRPFAAEALSVARDAVGASVEIGARTALVAGVAVAEAAAETVLPAPFTL